MRYPHQNLRVWILGTQKQVRPKIPLDQYLNAIRPVTDHQRITLNEKLIEWYAVRFDARIVVAKRTVLILVACGRNEREQWNMTVPFSRVEERQSNTK